MMNVKFIFMMVIDSITSMYILYKDGSLTLHLTKSIPTGLLSSRLALHITYLYKGVNGDGTQGLINYPGFIHLLSSVFSERPGSISSSHTIHAVSPNLHYQVSTMH